jgi:hypothetical protein
MKNIRPITNPLNINSPDGKVVKSTLVTSNCQGSLMFSNSQGTHRTQLTVASLIGIRILCKVGCIVEFRG